MKIEELSIGNYVFNKHNNKIEKVQQILLNYHDELSVMLDYNDIYDVDELDPVYIKDVIDKLGFEKKVDGGFDYYQIFSDYYADIRMEEFEPGLGLYIIKGTAINDEFKFPSEIIITSQLHDLQNFLTKTQINIKIEL